MKIEVLGDGCARCNQMYQNVVQAVRESGNGAEVIKSTDVRTITEYGVLSMPGLAIDGELKVSGKVLDVEEIKEWLDAKYSVQNDQ